MAIRLYETKMEFDYDSSDGTVKTTHIVYIESDGLYFNGTITGTGAPGVIISSPVSADSSGLATGDFEFQPNQIAFGSNTLFAKADGSGVVFSGTIGATLDSIEILPETQGTVAGFSAGGLEPPNAGVSTIDKFPFSISSGTATDVGDLSQQNEFVNGASSSTDGFTLGGGDYPFTLHPQSAIVKFPFAISGGTGTNVGDINPPGSVPLPSPAGGIGPGAGHYSTTDAFTSGGYSPGPAILSIIYKFPFAISGGVASDTGGDLLHNALSMAGYSDINGSSAFTSSGREPSGSPTFLTKIQKFPFSISSGTATNVGNINAIVATSAGNQSHTNGFSSGGYNPPNLFSPVNVIENFPFAISSGNATDVGNLSTAASGKSPSQSTTDAFASGGFGSFGPNYEVSVIDKFPFSISSGTATNVGNLTASRRSSAGHQD